MGYSVGSTKLASNTVLGDVCCKVSPGREVSCGALCNSKGFPSPSCIIYSILFLTLESSGTVFFFFFISYLSGCWTEPFNTY